jgi:hypothetical protein
VADMPDTGASRKLQISDRRIRSGLASARQRATAFKP